MTLQKDYQAARRAAVTMSEIKKAKQSLNASPVTMLARVALAVVYMYLILMSYTLMGISGPVFISLVFLVAFFIPWGYARLRGWLEQRRAQHEQTTVGGESQPQA